MITNPTTKTTNTTTMDTIRVRYKSSSTIPIYGYDAPAYTSAVATTHNASNTIETVVSSQNPVVSTDFHTDSSTLNTSSSVTMTTSAHNYYGYRYYTPPLGRWINRDPIWEFSWWAIRHSGDFTPLQWRGVLENTATHADVNSYATLHNSMIGRFDPHGLCAYSSTLGKCVEQKPPPYNPWDGVNGCGSAAVNVPDDPMYYTPPDFISCSFTPQCNVHDSCYATCNSGKGNCDYNFYQGLLGSCYDCYLNNFSWWDPNGWIWLGDCSAVALTYYTGVAAGGGGPYKNAQEKACQDCCCP